MYNKSLSLYFVPPYEQFPTFSCEYKQHFTLMLILHGMDVCYYFYILWGHFSKVILATDEVLWSHAF